MTFDTQKNFWLGPDAKVLACDYPNGVSNDHISIALAYLDKEEIPVKDRSDKAEIYGELFKRGFLRANELQNPVCGDELFVDNDGRQPTDAQSNYLLFKQSQGFSLKLNSKAYESTRDGRENARVPVSDVMRKALEGTIGS
jgi:hypothetical protein